MASIKFLPGATIRWHRRRYVIVDYAGLNTIVGENSASVTSNLFPSLKRNLITPLAFVPQRHRT